MSGVAIAQAIPVLCSPILSRLFTPDDFGLFANFMAIVAFVGVLITGKYELAILLPRRNQEAINVLSLCCLLAISCSLPLAVLFFIFRQPLASLLNAEGLQTFLWLAPISALLSAIFLIFNEWCIRTKRFPTLGKNKISNTAGIAGTSILFGLTKLQPGLIFGQLFGQVFSASSAVVRVFHSDRHLFAHVTGRRIKYFARKYVDFLKYFMPAQLISTMGGQIPILLLSTYFGLYEVGLFALSERVLGVPVTFLGNSFKDVFKQRASQDYQAYGSCVGIFKKTTFTLIKLAIVPFTVLFIVAPWLFAFVFGTEWYEAGEYTRYLSLMYLISFINTPTSGMIIIAEKQKLEVLWQLSYLLLTVASLLIGISTGSIKNTLILFCIGRSIAYFLQITISYKLAKGSLRHVS